MNAAIDLHIHTSASEDGELAPRDIVALAAERGLRAIAFSDHDSLASVDDGVALTKDAGIDFVPGVEMTTLLDEADVHVLGYCLDWTDKALLAACQATRDSRAGQAKGRIARMRALGFEIDFDRVMEIAAGRPPTSAILMVALRESFARSRDERLAPYIEGAKSGSPGLNLFLDYFSPGKPCYVPADTIDSRDAIRLIRAAGGVPVIAHPGRMAPDITETLIRSGAEGLEVYSSNHTPEQEAFYEKLARERGLVMTAGSDFHGPGRKIAQLGALRGGTVEMVEALRARQRLARGG